ncbi:CsbD family protein [Pseudonocardia xishanensis]|uniref:CsbD family protein n=1 Tax=Pseudonocardia xishanensis TaxID=630995 RepID=UPI0031EBAF87
MQNKGRELAGKAKEKVGEATGNDELVAEGRADQVGAGAKQAGEKVEDAGAEVRDTVRDTLGR